MGQYPRDGLWLSALGFDKVHESGKENIFENLQKLDVIMLFVLFLIGFLADAVAVMFGERK